jgi:hypothetical protein
MLRKASSASEVLFKIGLSFTGIIFIGPVFFFFLRSLSPFSHRFTKVISFSFL